MDSCTSSRIASGEPSWYCFIQRPPTNASIAGGNRRGAAMPTQHHLVAPPVIIAATPVRPLASPQPAIAPSLPPVCTVDLMTLEGSASFGAQWKTREAKIIEVPAIPDAMPEFTTTYDIDPHAGEAGFDDSAWPQPPPRPPLRQCVIPLTGFGLAKTASCEGLSTAPHVPIYYSV